MSVESEIVNTSTSLKKKFIELSHKYNALKFGDFTLRCGIKTNVFYNSGDLSDAESFDMMTDLIVAKLVESGVEFDAIIGLPYKGIPLLSVVCNKYYKVTGKNVYFGYHRKEEKKHGEGSLFVGAPFVFSKGTRVVILDDVLVSGDAIRRGFEILYQLELNVVSVLVFLNREIEYGAVAKMLKERNLELQEVIKLDEITDVSNVIAHY